MASKTTLVSVKCLKCCFPLFSSHDILYQKFKESDLGSSTSILGGRGGGVDLTSVWRQNLGQGPAKFAK